MTAIARFTHRFGIWVIGLWVLAAIIGNSVAPQLEQVVAAENQPPLPSGTLSSVAVQRSAAAFAQVPNDNISYVVLERHGPLSDGDRAFYDQLIAALRSDPRHVIQIMDWWGAPGTAGAALSNDQHAATALLRLSGMLGTAQARESIVAARDIVGRLHVPDGLQVSITGAGPAIVDQFAAIEKQMSTSTAIAVAVLLVLLLIAYRSLTTALVSLISVGLALVVARPIVAALGAHNLIGVSLFSVAFGTMVVLGAGTGFAVFLIGRYHEQRRQNIASKPVPESALVNTYRGALAVIAGSALSLTAAVGCLGFSQIRMFHNIGIPCAIGVLVVALVALTFTPALIELGDRANLLRPRRQGIARRWRRLGVAVARSPGPALLGSATLIVALALPLPGPRFGWDEASATPLGAESTRGYQAVDRHFPANQLLPDFVTIETDHDIRNPTGLLAIEQITGAIMTIPGVRMVQSASRLDAAVPQQATLTVPALNLGDRLEDAAVQLASRPATLTDLDIALEEMVTALDGIQNGLQNGTGGLGQVSSAAIQLRGAITKLRAGVAAIAEIFAPLPDALTEVPDCLQTQLCSAVQAMMRWADLVFDSCAKLANGIGHLADGIAASAQALAGLSAPAAFNLNGLTSEVQGARAATAGLQKLINGYGTPIRELPAYLHNLAAMFRGSPGVGLNVALKALTDPKMRPVLDSFLSPNGRAALLLVYGEGERWAGEGTQRAPAIMAAVAGATKGGALKPTAVEITGVRAAIRDLQVLEGKAVMLLGAIALFVVFMVVSLLLKSPVAGFIVLGTVVTSYASALGASVKIWQYLIGHPLHWSVPLISFLVLIAVGSACNLQLALRVREELPAGPRVGVMRAFGASGGQGIAAGIDFAATMFALVVGSALNVTQIGVTVGIGLVLDVLVVRSFVLPAVMVLLGRWFWWPRPLIGTWEVSQRFTA